MAYVWVYDWYICCVYADRHGSDKAGGATFYEVGGADKQRNRAESVTVE